MDLRSHVSETSEECDESQSSLSRKIVDWSWSADGSGCLNRRFVKSLPYLPRPTLLRDGDQKALTGPGKSEELTTHIGPANLFFFPVVLLSSPASMIASPKASCKAVRNQCERVA